MNCETEIAFERRARTQTRNIKIAERTQIHSKGAVSRRSPRKMKINKSNPIYPGESKERGRGKANSNPILGVKANLGSEAGAWPGSARC